MSSASALLKKLDLFDNPRYLPAFNIKGKSSFQTITGGVMSIVVMLIVFLFSLQKLQHLLMRQNPSINTYMELEAFTAEDKLNLEKENVRIAFTLEDYFTREPKMDPKYVKWFGQYIT